VASAPDRFVVDACTVVAIRKAGTSVHDWLGAIDVVPTLIVIDELLFGLRRDHPVYRANVALLAQMGPPITNRPVIKFAADRLIAEYARHQHPPYERDAMIAAAAMEEDRALITHNRSDFHFVERLWLVDPNGYEPDIDGPLVPTRAPVQGTISPTEPCCEPLRADRRAGSVRQRRARTP
jgi:predicted nucleic acid-binding protein